ncbi:hypothetical protein [Shewanella sp. 125m-1]
MKLSLATPNSDIDNTFTLTVMSECSDYKLLMAKGREYVQERETDRDDLVWDGNPLIGDEPIHSIKRWTMDLADGSMLIIE